MKRWFLNCVSFALFFAVATFAIAADIDELRRLKGEFNKLMSQSRFQEAEQKAHRIVTIADASFSKRPDVVAEALYMHGRVLYQLSRYEDAEAAMERQLSAIDKLQEGQFKTESIAWAANNLALVEHGLGKMNQAERRFRQASELFEKLEGADSESLGAALHNLGNLCRAQGRYIEAEYLQRRALAIRQKAYGEQSAIVGGSYDDLGRTLRDQNRLPDAEQMFLKAKAIFNKTGPDTLDMALCVNNLGNLYRMTGQYDQAEPLHQQGLSIWQKTLGERSQDAATTLAYLARLEIARNRLDSASSYTKRCREILESIWGTSHPDLAIPRQLEIELLVRKGKLKEAQQLADELISLRDQFEAAPLERANAYAMRADLKWKQNNQADALTDMKQALKLAEKQHAQSSGTEFERSDFYRSFATMFATMIAWQVQTQDVEGAFQTMEASRAAVLRNQLNAGTANFPTDLSAADERRLKSREAAAASAAQTAKKALEAAVQSRARNGEPSVAQLSRLSEDLRSAQKNAVAVKAEIQSASPSYRQAQARIDRVLRLSELQEFLTQEDAALVEFRLGQSAGYVLTVRPGEMPRIDELNVSKEAASILGAESGPLTDRLCRRILESSDGKGILQALASPKQASSDAFNRKLAALTTLLLPESLRTALLEERIKNLIVVPDVSLSKLPFETLILGDSTSGVCLLDVTDSVVNAPSATVLKSLKSGNENTSGGGIVSIGDADTVSKPGVAGVLSQQAIYLGLGGHLERLAHTGTECSWLAKNFRDIGVSTTELTKRNATEQSLRKAVSKKQLVHFACHGFADDRLGNAFGALALTPGAQSSDPADDGFLTLTEISGLDLRSCEMAILSACETNLGPQQQGEGVWALSRGFLIAGARRVVATNWSVDDEASASLVSYFAGGLAQDWKKPSGPQYGKRLQQAKKWVRSQDKWKSPHYWASFVLVGPK